MRLHAQRKHAHYARPGRDPGAVCRAYGGTDHGAYDRADGYPRTHNGAHSNTGADRNACSYGSTHNCAYGYTERSGYRDPGSEQ